MRLVNNKYSPIHGYIRGIVIIYQKLVILTKQAIVLVNVEIGGCNGTGRLEPLTLVSHIIREVTTISAYFTEMGKA
jgi:hypothetical protein